MIKKIGHQNRTTQQNRRYWQWLTELSNELVAHGVDMREAIQVPLTATPELLHQQVVHKIIKAKYNKDSTTELSTTEMSDVTDLVTQVFSERTEGNVYVPFDPKPDWYENF